MKLVNKAVTSAIVVVAVIALANIPLHTRQGVNGVVRMKVIPLYAKCSAFLARDYEYKSLLAEIIAGKRTDEEKITAIFDWTVKHIKKTPPGFDTYDDHIWNIIVRQYGAPDQMADVFTTLASYAGYPSFFANVSPKGQAGKRLTLGFILYGTKWHIFDVAGQKMFVDRSPLDPTPDGIPYSAYINNVDKGLFLEYVKRPDKQKIFPRIIYEIQKRLPFSGVKDPSR